MKENLTGHVPMSGIFLDYLNPIFVMTETNSYVRFSPRIPFVLDL